MMSALAAAPGAITWPAAVCIALLVLPRILRRIPPILRERRYNRLAQVVARADPGNAATLAAAVQLIEKHEDSVRVVEGRAEPAATEPTAVPEGRPDGPGGGPQGDGTSGPRAVA